MTTSEMITTTRVLAGDPNSQVWTTSSPVLSALTVAQSELVIGVLGATPGGPGFNALSDLGRSSVVSVGVAGYDLSGLPKPMARNGFMNAKATLDGLERFFTVVPGEKLGLMSNRYLGGENQTPKCYILGGKFYASVSPGSYPVQVTLYYIAVPSTLTTSSTPELNALYHPLLCVMAEEVLRRSIDQIQEASYLRQSVVNPSISLISAGAFKEPKTGTVGQYMRTRETATGGNQ